MNELKAKSILLGLVLCGGLGSAQVYEMTSGETIYPAGISDNGTVVMSSSAGNFMWTEADGFVILNTISNGFENAGNPSISNDGTKISGTFTHPESNMNGWGLYDVASGNWTPLEGIGGETDGSESSAWGISGDGSTIVGLGWVDAGTAHAIKWTEADGTVDMGSTVPDRSSRANGVNTDGSVIVGWQDGVTGFRQGAIWIDGKQTLLTDADGVELGEAGAVSGDGNWVIGGGMEAWIWNAEQGLQTISHPNGGPFFRGSSTAVSDDGSVVVGFYRAWPGPPMTGEGFIWTPETGRVDLNEYVTSLGMDDLGITFGLPLAISSDGTMIAGTGTTASNQIVTFLIKLPQEEADYCQPTLNCTDGDLITNVTFEGINNDSSCSPDGYGDYTEMVAEVSAGQTYPISVTVGDGWFERVSLWIDFGNDGSFDPEDFLGEIGEGGQGITLEDEITIPDDVANGEYRMRVLVYAAGSDGTASEDPCINDLSLFGEYEDYTISVGDMNVSDLNNSDLSFYPNPVKDVLNLNSKSPIQNVSVYNLVGQKVISNANLTNNQINVSSLNSGVYVFRVTLQNGKTETFKVVKK